MKVRVPVALTLLASLVACAGGEPAQESEAELVERANNGTLTRDDLSGASFTVSNLGMYGIDEFTAIINAPDSCILAVGGINAVPVVKDGAVVPGHVMKVTLSCDHRSVDGASGAAFLQDFKNYLENPVQMLANGY